MEAIEWLFDTIEKKATGKSRVIGCIFCIIFFLSLLYVSEASAICFGTLGFGIALGRMFFGEIAKNNVIPLKIISGDMNRLLQALVHKVMRMELPYYMIMLIVLIVYGLFHGDSFYAIILNAVTLLLYIVAWIQCAFIHFGLIFLNSKYVTLFEVGVFLLENIVLQMAEIMKLSSFGAVIAGVVLMLCFGKAGRRYVTYKL